MKKDVAIFASNLKEKVRAEDFSALRDFCSSMHPASVAEALSSLEPEIIWETIRHATAETKVEVFGHLTEEIQIEIVRFLKRYDVARLFSDMPPDDRADLFKSLPEEFRDNLLPALAQAEREDIRRLAAHKEGTAGSVMTSDYATLSPEMRAFEAIDRLREVAPDAETIYYAYVVDDKRFLLGFVSLKDLIVARRDLLISEIMNRVVVFARVDDDQEEAARAIQKYDILALPIVNEDNALVGIITHDDAMDIITQEHTEDMERFMAISGDHDVGGYFSTSSVGHFRKRVGWLVGLAILSLGSGFIIHHYEDVLAGLIMLSIYMPMISSTGGNTGGQSATVVIRALALREITPANILKVFWKEFKIALMLAAVLSVVMWAKVVFLSEGISLGTGLSLTRIGAVVAMALGLQVISSNMIGALLPIVAARFRIDPAIVASPTLATIVDMSGLFLYFLLAKSLLGV